MSITLDSEPETVAQRSARATIEFCDALGLDKVKNTELPFLTIALAEVATDRARADASFAERVRTVFLQLAVSTPKATKAKKKSFQQDQFKDLVAIGPVDLSRLRPNGLMDPYALVEAYGSAQTEQVLRNQPLGDLKRMAEIVEQRNPGTKSTTIRTKVALASYIIAHIPRR